MITIHRLFPVLAICIAALAWYNPSPLLGLDNALPALLMSMSLFVGLQLRWQDFRRVWHKPEAIALGVILQFTTLPILVFLLSLLLNHEDIQLGWFIAALCAGSMISIALVSLTDGDNALAVSINIISVGWSVIATPWLLQWLFAITITPELAQILPTWTAYVIFPLAIGMALRQWLPQATGSLLAYQKTILTLLLLTTLALVVANHQSEFLYLTVGTLLLLATYNILALIITYRLARAIDLTVVEAKTIALVVAMQPTDQSAHFALTGVSYLASLVSHALSATQLIAASLFCSYHYERTQRNIAQSRQQQGIAATLNKSENSCE